MFQTSNTYMWCVALITARFFVFKLNNRNIKIRCEICSNLTTGIPE